MLDDLDVILNDISEQTKEVKESIKVLEKEEPKEKSAPELLEEYTDNEKSKEGLELELQAFKEKYKEIFVEYDKIQNKLNDINNGQIKLKEDMTKAMEKQNLKTIINDLFRVTFVAPTKKSTFDRKAFETKYPVLCKQFLKYSDVKAYVKISEVKKGD